MTDLHRKPQKKGPVEAAMIQLTMLIGLIFSGWMIYHFVRIAGLGINVAIP